MPNIRLALRTLFKSPGPKPGSNSCSQAGGCDEVFSYPMFRDLEKAQASFTGIAAHLVAIGAGFLPALRASKIDPMTALRYE